MSTGESSAIYTFDELLRIRDATSLTLPGPSLKALRDAGILREIIDNHHHTSTPTPTPEESHPWKASSEGSWRTYSNPRIMDNDPQTPTSLTTPTTPTPPQQSNTLSNRSSEAFKPRTPLSETDRMVKEVKGLLNKITPQKYEAIAPQIVRFFDANTSSTIIPLIFEKAFHEMAFCEMYADLFCDLHGKMATTAQSHTSLLLALRLRCDLELKKALVSDEAEATSSESTGEKKLKRSVGISQFIAELFLRDILQEDVLFQWACRLLCINTTTNNTTPTTETLPTELQVEVACKMIETCGQQWENSSPRFLSTILPNMQRLHSNSSKPRMGFMIQDVLESRKAGWAKRFKKEKPSKISERTGTLTSTTVRRSITPPARPMVMGMDDAYRMRGRTPPPRANRPIPLLPINPTPPGSAPTSPIPIGMRAAPGSPVPGPLLMHHSAPNTPNIPVMDLVNNNWSMSYQQYNQQEQPAVYHTHSYPYSPEQRFSHYQAALDQYQDPNGWSSPPTNQANPPWQSTNTGQSQYSPGDHYRQNWQTESEQRRPAENWRSSNRTSSSCPNTPAPSTANNKPVFSPPQLGQMSSPQSSPSHTPTASPSHPTNPMPPSPNTPTPLPRTQSGSSYGGPRRNSPPRWIPVEPPAPLPAKSKPGSFK